MFHFRPAGLANGPRFVTRIRQIGYGGSNWTRGKLGGCGRGVMSSKAEDVTGAANTWFLRPKGRLTGFCRMICVRSIICTPKAILVAFRINFTSAGMLWRAENATKKEATS